MMNNVIINVKEYFSYDIISKYHYQFSNILLQFCKIQKIQLLQLYFRNDLIKFVKIAVKTAKNIHYRKSQNDKNYAIQILHFSKIFINNYS